MKTHLNLTELEALTPHCPECKASARELQFLSVPPGPPQEETPYLGFSRRKGKLSE